MPTEKFVSGASAKLLILLNLKPGLFSHHQSLAVYFIFSRVIIRPNDPALLGLRLGVVTGEARTFHLRVEHRHWSPSFVVLPGYLTFSMSPGFQLLLRAGSVGP